MSIPSCTLKFTSDSLANSMIEWGATDLAWYSPSSDLGDWVGASGVNPPPPSPITGSQLFDWVGIAGVDPSAPPPITGAQLTGVDPSTPPPIPGAQLARVDPLTPLPITDSLLLDWVGSTGNNANHAYSSSGMLNAWHEAANVTLVQAVSGVNINFQY